MAAVVGAAVVIPGAGLELARGAPARVRGPAGAVLLVGGRVVGRGFGSGAESDHKEQRMYDILWVNKVLTFARAGPGGRGTVGSSCGRAGSGTRIRIRS